ncbi:MAG: hypothetical protein AXA67_10340 [Methylothermaceae bacteria B42]|nr:MAG: hypothetical protein AXA67_10340 [Methylothermaceae bacteria B42]HHJ40533.1 NUDIX domain-containing protein [Methylothermaceae bacterium]
MKEDEILPVVDENDQVIDFRPRGEVHRLGLRHRSVHLLVFNSKSEVLLQKRSRQKAVKPGFWDSTAAGHVDAEEDYDQCVLREVKEELGIQLPEIPHKAFKIPASQTTGMEFCQVYTAIHQGPFQPNPEEIEQLRWFTPEQIKQWLAQGGEGLTNTVQFIFDQLPYPII